MNHYPLRATKDYAQRWACFDTLLSDYSRGKVYKAMEISDKYQLTLQQAYDVRRAVHHAYRIRLYSVGRRPCRYCTRLIPKSDGDVCEDCREEKRWRILLKPPPDNPLKDNPYFLAMRDKAHQRR